MRSDRHLVQQVLAVTSVAFMTLTSAAALSCPEPSASDSSAKLLIVTGGHPYEPSEFFKAFDGMPNVRYDHVLTMEGKPVAVPAGGLKARYDVVLFYDMEDKVITPEWRSLLDRGAGLVFLHHAIGSFPGSPEYKTIVGGHGNFFGQPWSGVPNSIPYEADERQRFSIIDRTHPITCGMADFEMKDEPYDDIDIDPAIHALIRSSNPRGVPWSHGRGVTPKNG